VTADLGNGKVFARLLGKECEQAVGQLYLWESDDLGIMWTGEDREISFVDRSLDAEVLLRAKAANSAELVRFLEVLPLKAARELD
jgi:hypothetical protein